MRIFWKPWMVFCLFLLVQNGYCSEREFLKDQVIVGSYVTAESGSDRAKLSDIHVVVDDSFAENSHSGFLAPVMRQKYLSEQTETIVDEEMIDISNTDGMILLRTVNKKLRLDCNSLDKLISMYKLDADVLVSRLAQIGYHYDNMSNQFKSVTGKSYDKINYDEDRSRSYGMSPRLGYESLKENNQLSISLGSPSKNRQKIEMTDDFKNLFKDGTFPGKENDNCYHTNYHKDLEIFLKVDKKLELLQKFKKTMVKFEPSDVANILEEYTGKKKTARQLCEKYLEYNLDEGILINLCEIGRVQEFDNNCVAYYRDLAKQQELEELYDILCSHMQIEYGEDACKTEGPERILKVVQIYQREFKEFINQNKWNLKEMLQDKDYQKVKQQNQYPDDNYQLKKKVLASLLPYYTTVTNQMSVDAIVQASVGVITCNRTCDKQCYLPHRDEELSCEKCKNHYKKGRNWKAVGLACLSLWLQIVVPVAIIYKNIALNQDTLMPLDSGEMIKSICPSFILHVFGEDESAAQISYNFVTRITGTGLLFLLNKQLVTDLAEEYEQFIVNCSNHALPQEGLIVSRVMNSIVYMLINGTTMILFIQNPTLHDMLLNFLAMEMLMKIDDILAKYVPIKNGIGSSNDKGRKLLLTFLTKGERKDTWAESILSYKFIKFLLTFGQFVIILIFIWNFGCVGPENL